MTDPAGAGGTSRPRSRAPRRVPPQPGLVNLANALTVIRLVLVPVVVACLLAGGTGWRVAAFVAFGRAPRSPTCWTAASPAAGA